MAGALTLDRIAAGIKNVLTGRRADIGDVTWSASSVEGGTFRVYFYGYDPDNGEATGDDTVVDVTVEIVGP